MSTLTIAEPSGAYRDEEQGELSRWTAFVEFSPGPEAGAIGRGEIEEIDVDATSESAARRVAQAALDRDYEPGGKILRVEQRWGWYW